MREKLENPIEKVNLKDEKILVFEKIPNTDYYKPLNKNALNYLKKEYEKYREEKLSNIEYTIVDEKEATLKKFETNLIGKFLGELRVKNKGLIKITDNILVYLNTKGEPTPLDSKAEEKQEYLSKLVTQSPAYCKEAWLKINNDFKTYFTLI